MLDRRTRPSSPPQVHWAPAFIPNAAIVKALEESCKVQSIVMETSTSKGFEDIPTGIRRLVLAGNKDEIPHVFNIVYPNMASSLKKVTFQWSLEGSPTITVQRGIRT